MIISEDVNITEKHYVDAKAHLVPMLDSLSPKLHYHGKGHALAVSHYAMIISHYENMSISDVYFAGILGMGHDLGFLKKYRKNEPVGASFLAGHMLDSNFKYSIDRHVLPAIYAVLSTDPDVKPFTDLGKILRDADMAYMHAQDFPFYSEQLRLETLCFPESDLSVIASDKVIWREAQIEFLKSHKWETKSAELLFEDMKKYNLDMIDHY